MHGTAVLGGFSDAPVQAARVFRAALDAMARPGKVHRVSGASAPAPMSPAAACLALTLCDAEAPVHLAGTYDTGPVRDWFAFHTGAPVVARQNACFVFGSWEDCLPLDDFMVGSAEHPDRSATLIVEVRELGRDHRLTGPGIEAEAWLTLPDPALMQANAARFPLGLDFFLTCGDRLAGLPRTTRIG